MSLGEPGAQRDGDDDQHDRPFIGEHQRHFAGEADCAVGRSGGRAGDHERDAGDGQQIKQDQKVADQRIGAVDARDGDQRNREQHRGRAHEGGREEHRFASRFRHHRALEAKLDDIVERLDERRPDPALQPGGDAAVGAFQREPEREGEQPAGEEQHGDEHSG